MITPSVYLFEPLKEDPVFAAGKFGFLDLKTRHIADEWTMLDMKNFQELTQNDFLLEPDQQSYHWTRMLTRSHTVRPFLPRPRSCSIRVLFLFGSPHDCRVPSFFLAGRRFLVS